MFDESEGFKEFENFADFLFACSGKRGERESYLNLSARFCLFEYGVDGSAF